MYSWYQNIFHVIAVLIVFHAENQKNRMKKILKQDSNSRQRQDIVSVSNLKARKMKTLLSLTITWIIIDSLSLLLLHCRSAVAPLSLRCRCCCRCCCSCCIYAVTPAISSDVDPAVALLLLLSFRCHCCCSCCRYSVATLSLLLSLLLLLCCHSCCRSGVAPLLLRYRSIISSMSLCCCSSVAAVTPDSTL